MDTKAGLLKAQKQLCDEKGAPMFMPSNGVCWHCHRSIVESLGDRMKTELITGCPLCHRTYCD